MKRILIAILFASASIFSTVACQSEKEKENAKLTAKLEEMKQCLKYTDQEACEVKIGMKIYKHETGNFIFKDSETDKFVLPIPSQSGQNTQPQYQTFNQYPPAPVVNNYYPPQQYHHGNSDFFFGAMLGMALSHGSYYPPSAYHNGVIVNRTTVINNNTRSYSPSADRQWSQQRTAKLERYQRIEQARNQRAETLRQERQIKHERAERARELRRERSDPNYRAERVRARNAEAHGRSSSYSGRSSSRSSSYGSSSRSSSYGSSGRSSSYGSSSRSSSYSSSSGRR